MRIWLKVFFLVSLVTQTTVYAQVRQSSNYQIQSDSINVGGGFSSSTNFVQESTAGEVATGESGSSNYSLYAGYQQMQEVYIALSGGVSVVMNGSLVGIGGGTSYGSTSVQVLTDSPSGYQLSISAENSPAMNDGVNSIADYTPAGADPDLHFSIAESASEFAFSPYGNDVVQRYLTNNVVCNVSGSASTTACWDGLSTSDTAIAQATNANHPTGATTTIYFRVGIGAASVQVPGTYVATTTVTALPL